MRTLPDIFCYKNKEEIELNKDSSHEHDSGPSRISLKLVKVLSSANLINEENYPNVKNQYTGITARNMSIVDEFSSRKVELTRNILDNGLNQ